MKKAFTVVEVLAVCSIIAILVTATVIPLNSAWRNSQIDNCESDLRDVSNGFKSYITDYGNILIAPDVNYDTVLGEVLKTLNSQYLSFQLEIDEVASDKRSVRLASKTKTDPWKSPYYFSIYTYSGDDADSIPGLIVISSRGLDGKSNADTYEVGDYGDDVISVIEPR